MKHDSSTFSIEVPGLLTARYQMFLIQIPRIGEMKMIILVVFLMMMMMMANMMVNE